MKNIILDSKIASIIAYLIIILSNNTFSKPPSADIVINKLKYVDLTSYLEKEFIKTYGEKKSSEIRYEDIVFSPDGQYLAITISQIRTGDRDEVWIIDLKTKKCRSVINLIDIDLYHIEWISDSLLKVYLETIYIPNQGLNKNKVLIASIDQTTESNEKWPAHFANIMNNYKPTSKYYKLEWPDNNKLLITDIQTGKKRFMKGSNELGGDVKWTYDEKQFVSSLNYGHGYSELLVGFTSPLFRVIRLVSTYSGVEYDNSPYSPEIVYTVGDDSCFVIYDTSKRKIVRKVNTGSFPGIISWGKNKVIAFVSMKIGKESFLQDTQRLYVIELK